jgi:4-amino-4-deoxy-L-arabinose transferase-like glycosyltransferase
MSEAKSNGQRRKLSIILLVNLSLLALFIWTLTETTTLRIEVADGVCTAILADRTNSIPCPGLEGGHVGLYRIADDERRSLASNPWRLLIPNSSWRSLTLAGPDGSDAVALVRAGQPTGQAIADGGWRTTAGELQAITDQAIMQWPNLLPDDFELEAQLRRPVDLAGLQLLQPDGSGGYSFLYNSSTRLGTWWRLVAGGGAEPIIGAPFQESLIAQVQSLLRTILVGHQAGLLLFLASWLLALLLAWGLRRLRRSPKQVDSTAAEPNAGSPESNLAEPVPDVMFTGLQNQWWVRPVVIGLMWWVFTISLFVSGDLLGGIPHVQDSITYRFQAQTLARGQLTASAPPEPDAFEQEFLLVKDGRWFGKYPPGYPLLLAAAERLGLSELTNPLLATLTVATLFTLGKIWYRRRVGLLAALLAAVSPFFLIMSGTFMAHTAELFWLSLFLLSWSFVVRQRASSSAVRLAWLVSTGFALGMVFLTRQLTALAAAGPFLLATTLILPGHERWSTKLKELLGLAIATAPFALLLLLYQGAVTGDPFQDPRLLFWSYDHLGFGQDIGQGQNVANYEKVQGETILAWHNDPSQPPRGHNPTRGVFNLERNWRQLQDRLFGWLPVFTMAFAWLVFALGRQERADWIFLITALSLMIVYVFYWANGISYGPRYFYAALPALLLLVARGIETSVDSIGGRPGKWVVGIVLVIFIAGGLLFYFPAALEELEQYNFVDGAKVAAVEEAVDGQALVLIAPENGDWWEYGTYFTANTPWLDGRIIYARDMGAAANARLQAEFPDRAVYLLQDGQLLPLNR